MADFIDTAFKASQALGGPHRLARCLGVEPDEIYRWIAGRDLPAEGMRLRLQQRISLALVVGPAGDSANRRHGDGFAS